MFKTKICNFAILTVLLFFYLTYSTQSYALNSNSKIKLADMRNPNEDFLTTLTNEKTNNKNIIIAQKNNSQKKEYRYNKMLNTHKITSLNLELSDIHKNLPEHISNELSQKKGVTKKASIDFGFNPNENLKLYLTSTIGEVNYSNTAQGDATRLQLTPNVNNLKVGVKFNF